jgi:hypothetical protein
MKNKHKVFSFAFLKINCKLVASGKKSTLPTIYLRSVKLILKQFNLLISNKKEREIKLWL